MSAVMPLEAAVVPALPRTPRERTQHYLGIERLLHKIASKTLPRALAVEPSMEHEDLVQMYAEVYTRCLARWDPSQGAKFSTYLSYACMNRFNDWMRDRERERVNLSAYSLEATSQMYGHKLGNDFEGADTYERLSPDEVDKNMDAATAIDLKRNIELGFGVSPPTRQVLNLLVSPSAALNEAFEARRRSMRLSAVDPSLSFIFKFLNMSRQERSRVREEITRVYGVDMRTGREARA